MLYAVLTPFDAEQNDLLLRLHHEKRIRELPELQFCVLAALPAALSFCVVAAAGGRANNKTPLCALFFVCWSTGPWPSSTWTTF